MRNRLSLFNIFILIDSENVKIFKNLHILILHYFSQAMSDCRFLRSLFSLGKHKNMKILKIWSNKVIFNFHHVYMLYQSNQTTVFWNWYLAWKNVKKTYFSLFFHKPCQTTAFWGRYLGWESRLPPLISLCSFKKRKNI